MSSLGKWGLSVFVSTLTANAVTLRGGTASTDVGTDVLTLNGGGTLSATNLANVIGWDTWTLASAQAYTLTLNTANAGTGALTIDASSATSLTLDGSAETNGGTITVTGSAGVDTITGGSGADTFTGGGGADTLTGVGNSDTFRFTAISDSTSTARDTITDFAATDDSEDIFLDSLGVGTFSFVGASSNNFAGSGNTSARFDDTNERLEIDIDGDGTADMEITLTGVTASQLAAADFTVTLSGLQSVSGTQNVTLTSGADIITGSGSNDIITLIGNAAAGDNVDLAVGTGDSLILAAGGNTISIANVEALTGGSGVDVVTVTAGGNIATLASGLAAADTLISSLTQTLTAVTIASSFTNQGALTVQGTNSFSNSTASSFSNALGATLTVQSNDSGGSAVLTIATGFTNTGTIIQDNISSQGFSNTLTLTTGAITNTGTIRFDNTTSAGGRTFNGNITNQSGGIIDVDDGTTMGKSGAVYTNAGTIDIDSTLTIDNFTSLTNSGTIDIASGSTLTLLDGTTTTAAIVNAGTLSVESGGVLNFNVAQTIASGATLEVKGGSDIGGTGTLTNQGSLILNDGQVTNTLVNSATITVQNGSNTIDGTLTNSGTLLVQSNDSGGSAVLTIATGFTNTGTIIQDNISSQGFSNTLTLTTGAITNTGTIRFDNTTSAGGRTFNGNITNQSGGTIDVDDGTTFTNASGATLELESATSGTSALVTIANGFTNAGTIRLDNATGNSNVAAGLTVSSGTLTNTGTILSTNTSGDTDSINSLTGTLTSSGTITATQSLTLTNTSTTFTNSGTIGVASGEIFTVSGGTVVFNSGSAFASATGTLALTSSANLTFNTTFASTTAKLTMSGGTISTGGSNTLSIGSTATLTNVTVNVGYTNTGTTTVTTSTFGTTTAGSGIATTNTSGTMLFKAGTSTINGNFSNASGATLELESATSGTSALVTIANGFTNAGTIRLDNATGNSNVAAGLTVSSGTLTNTGTILSTNTSGDTDSINSLTGTLPSSGTITATQSLTVNKSSATHVSSGIIDIAGSQTLTFSGTSTSLTNQSGGIIKTGESLSLIGTLNVFAVTFTNSGTLSPGGDDALGTLNITGNVAQTSTSMLGIDITSTTTYDQMNVSGSYAVDGTLALDFCPGSAPTGGNSYANIVTYASKTGTVFDTVTHNLSAAYTLTVTINPNDIDLSIASTFQRTWDADTLPSANNILINAATVVHATGTTTSINSLTASGTGSFTLSGGSLTLAAASRIDSATSFTFSGGTLAGAGTLYTMGAVTLGTATLDANLNLAGASTINSSSLGGAGTLTNLGSMTATSTGFTGTETNTSGTFTVSGTSAFSKDTANSFTNASGATLKLETSSSSSSVSNLTIANAFTNAGTIILTDSTSLTSSSKLTVTTGTLTNTGTIQFANVNSTETLDAALDNQGTLDINSTKTVTLTNTSRTFTNTGTIDVASGATFTVSGGAVVFDSGTVLSGTGTLSLSSITGLTLNTSPTIAAGLGLSVSGGAISTGGSSAISMAGAATFSSTTINAGFTNTGATTLTSSTVNVDYTSTGGTTATSTGFTGTVTNTSGTFTVSGTSAFSKDTANSFTNASGATLKLEASSSSSSVSNLTIANAFTNAGTIILTDSTSLTSSSKLTVTTGTLTNTGTIQFANVNSTETLDADLTNTGLIDVNASATLSKTGGTHSSSGTIDIASGATLTVNGTSLANSGTINMTGGTLAGTAAVSNSGAILVQTGSATISSTFSNASGATLEIEVSTTSNANLTIANGFTNAGTLRFDDVTGNSTSRSGLTDTTGTLTNTGTIISVKGSGSINTVHSLTGALTSSGTIDVDQSLTINGIVTNTGTIDIAAGETLTITGSAFNNLTPGVIQSGTTGTLDVSGVTLFTNTGALSPGGAGAIGTLTVTGSVAHSNTASHEIDVAGTSSFDKINFSGNYDVDGALNFNFLGGAAPASGTGYEIVTYASHSGQSNYDNLASHNLSAAFTGTPSLTATTVTFTATFDNTFDGSTNNTFATSANWSTGGVPTEAQNILIDNNFDVTHASGTSSANSIYMTGTGTSLTLSGGTIQIDAQSRFNSGTTFTMTGGTFADRGVESSTGTLYVAGSLLVKVGTATVSAGLDILAGGTLAIQGQGFTTPTLTLGGTATNAGLIQLDDIDNANGDNAVLTITGSLTSTGTIDIDRSTSLDISGGGKVFNTIGGTVNVATGHTLTVNAGTTGTTGITQVGTGTVFTGAGTGKTDLTGTHTLTVSSDFTHSTAFLSFGGTVTVGGSSTFTIGSGGSLTLTADTFTAPLVVASGGTLKVQGGTSAINGTLNVNAGGTLAIQGQGFTTPTLTLGGTATNAGLIQLDDIDNANADNAVLNITSGTLANTGTIQSLNTGGGGTGARTIAAQIDNQSGGIVNIDYTATVGKTGAAHLNSGTINIAASQTLFFTGDSFTNQSGGVINITTGGTLNTSGVTAKPQAGTLNTGLSPGIGTIVGNISQSAGGILVSEIAGTAVGTGYDQLNISGNFQMGGTLDVRLIDGFAPVANDSFQVLTFGSGTGAFDAIAGLDLGTSMVLDAVITSTNLTLTATATTVSGTAAGETISGTAGNDVISAGDGDDLIFGGAGSDTVDYSGAAGDIAVSLAELFRQAVGADQGVDLLNGVENVIGSAGNDVLTGDSGANVLTGGAGADTLNLGSVDGSADIIRYTAFSDGAGDLTLADADAITQFEAGTDTIQFVNAGISLNGTGVVSIASGPADLNGTTNGVFYVNDATAAELGNLANVQSAIGALANVGVGEKGVFVVQNTASTQTGIYAFTDDGSADNTIAAAELDLMAVVDAVITDIDVNVV